MCRSMLQCAAVRTSKGFLHGHVFQQNECPSVEHFENRLHRVCKHSQKSASKTFYMAHPIVKKVTQNLVTISNFFQVLRTFNIRQDVPGITRDSWLVPCLYLVLIVHPMCKLWLGILKMFDRRAFINECSSVEHFENWLHIVYTHSQKLEISYGALRSKTFENFYQGALCMLTNVLRVTRASPRCRCLHKSACVCVYMYAYICMYTYMYACIYKSDKQSPKNGLCVAGVSPRCTCVHKCACKCIHITYVYM